MAESVMDYHLQKNGCWLLGLLYEEPDDDDGGGGGESGSGSGSSDEGSDSDGGSDGGSETKSGGGGGGGGGQGKSSTTKKKKADKSSRLAKYDSAALEPVSLEVDEAVTGAVINAMEFFMENDEVLREGCSALNIFAETEGNGDTMVKAGVVAVLLTAIKEHQEDEEILSDGLGAIMNLSACKSAAGRILKEEGLETMLEVMKGGEDDLEAQETLCGVLLNLSYHEKGCRRTMVTMGFYEKVVQALVTHGPASSRICSSGCALLGVLGALEGILCEVDIGGAVQTMVKTLVEHPNAPEVQSAALGALGALAKDNEEVQTILGRDDSIDAILGAFKTHLKRVVVMHRGLQSASAIVQREDAIEKVVDAGGIGLITAVVREHPAEVDVVKTALDLVGKMAAGRSDAFALAGGLPGVVGVVAAMKKHGGRPDIQCNGCAALQSLCSSADAVTQVTLATETEA